MVVLAKLNHVVVLIRVEDSAGSYQHLFQLGENSCYVQMLASAGN
jgi:hypothetical protein